MTLPEVEGGEDSGLAEVVAEEASHEAAVRRGVRRVELRQVGPGIVQGDEVPVRLGWEPRRWLGGRAARAKRAAFSDAECDRRAPPARPAFPAPVELDWSTVPDANVE